MFRTLLRRLRFELPTVYQPHPGPPLLFYKGGVREFAMLEAGTAYSDLNPKRQWASRIWALVDIDTELEGPGPLFRRGPFFVLMALSPRLERYEWEGHISSQFFHMSPWSFPELLQV